VLKKLFSFISCTNIHRIIPKRKKILFGTGENFFFNTQPPLCATSPPRETGLKGDDDGTENTTLSQPGGAIAARAIAGIAGALEKRYGNLI
jgi:hypothetical protein